MKRARFVPPRLAQPPAAAQATVTTSTADAATTSAAATPRAAFDCLFWGKRGRTADGTLLVRGQRAQLFDLELKERAAGSLPPATAAALHAAHAAAVAALAAGHPLGSLWLQDEAPSIAVGGFTVEIEDDRRAAVQQEEWVLRQRVGEEARAGKPKDAVGAAIPADSLGHRVLAGMGWQPGQGLQHGGGSGLVLPQLKWDKAGLGASTNVKLLGLGRTTFRRAGVAAGGMNDVADLQ